MGRGLDNYYLILELDFLKPESDLSVIEKQMKAKYNFWNANAERGKMQQKYRQYKTMYLDIGKVMKTENLRLAEAKDAQTFVQGILKEELTFFAGKKEIEASAANAIMAKAGIWQEIFEKMSGLKVVDAITEDSVPKVDPNPKPDKIAKFNKYETDLKVLNKENLYDFLAGTATTDIIGLQTLDGNELIDSYSNPLKERMKYEKTEEASSTRTLCAACEEIFDPKNTSLRENYDKYLIWQKKDAIITFMVKVAGSSKKLDADQKRQFTDRMTQIVRNRDEAVKIIEQICAFKELSSGAPIAPEPGKVLCGHCFSYVDTSHGEKKCSHCGSDLYIKCPSCGKEVLASLQACGHCGFRLDDVLKVDTMCRSAKEAIANMDFIGAHNYIAKAEKLLANYYKIPPLKKELKEKEDVFSGEIKKLNDLVKKKFFYEAIGILKELQKKVPTAKIPNDVLIETNVAQADALYKSAVSERREEELIRICTQIVNLCTDYPGVEALMLKYRPKPVSNIQITVDPKVCANTLVWEKSASKGDISYKILRKENTAVASEEDPAAKTLGVAGIPRFVDSTPKPGVNYYYTVYAIRAGVASSPVYVNAVNLADVMVVNREEGDGYIRVEWKPLDQNAHVNVCRCEKRIPKGPDDGVQIHTSGNYFRDDTVENDVSYGYLITISYRVEGKNITTSGVSEMLMASSVPDTVDDLEVSFVENDVFEASWTYPGKEKIELYGTDGRCALKYGDVTNISKVASLLKPVDYVSGGNGHCRFRIRDNKKYSIIPVTVKNSTAVVGAPAVAAKIEKITVNKVELLNSSLVISINWPEDAVSVLILYGEGGYAKSLEDRKGKTARTISKKQFEADGGLVLNGTAQMDYYISLYSACKVNGELVYSEGTQVLFSNKPKTDITYSIRVKGLFSKSVEVEFTSSASEFVLPDIDIVSKQNGIPVYANSGTVLEHIEEQQVTGSYKFKIAASAIPKDSCLKPFFSNEKLYETVSLRPAYGTNFKVN